MKKITSVFLLVFSLGAGVAMSAMNSKVPVPAAKPSPNPCDVCPPNWNCHSNPKTGEITCTCPKCRWWV